MNVQTQLEMLAEQKEHKLDTGRLVFCRDQKLVRSVCLKEDGEPVIGRFKGELN